MKYSFILFLILFPIICLPQTPTQDEIKSVAIDFLDRKKGPKAEDLKKGYKVTQIKSISPLLKANKTIANIVEITPSGFIVVSNNKSVEPIIAYSEFANFNFSTDTSNILYYLLFNDPRLNDFESYDQSDTWEKILTSSDGTSEFQQWPEAGTTLTGGWVETTWNQRSPYNQLFPLDPVTDKRVLTGCVTTAFAQLLNYHKTAGEYELSNYFSYTSKGLNNSNIEIDSDYAKADFASFNELNQLISSIKTKYLNHSFLTDEEISALNFLAAILVKANFSSESTSANIMEIPYLLKNFFKYSSCDISSSLNAELYSSLANNMRLGHPALISIQKTGGSGHLILCDGYNTEDFFHLNFGWGADFPETISEVWYDIPKNIPAEYSILNTVIYNIYPYTRNIYSSKSLIELFPLPGLSQTSFTLFSLIDGSISIDSDDFLLSIDGTNFSSSLENVNVNQNSEKTIWIKYQPSSSLIHDIISINMDNKVEAYIEVKGYEESNIIDSGPVSGIWDNTEKPYMVTGNIYVPLDKSLEVRKGVNIYFMNGSELSVPGQLVVKGAPQEPVIFTTLSAEDNWEGIKFENSGNDDRLEHAVILNSSSSGIEANNTDLFIINCYIANNYGIKGGGVSLVNSNSHILGSIIVNNYYSNNLISAGGGIYIENSNVEIINTTLSHNYSHMGGGIYSSKSDIELENSIIWDNRAYYSSDDQSRLYHKEISFDTDHSNINARYSIICDLETPIPQNNLRKLLEFISYDNVSSLSPGFINPSGNYGRTIQPLSYDWGLKKSSFAVNNGLIKENSFLPSTDFYGNPRIYLDNIDIGATECTDSARFISIYPMTYLDFPSTHMDSSTTRSISITNTGIDIIRISTYSTNMEHFPASENFDEKELTPKEKLVIEVDYTPESFMDRDTGYFIVHTTADNYPFQRIRFTGNSIKGKMIQGPVSGEWNKDTGPYIIQGDTWVDEGEKLSIEKGTEIYVNGNYSFEVKNNSILKIEGKGEDRVKFEGIKAWKGINFINCSKIQNISNISISNVKNSSAIQLNASRARILNSDFQNNSSCISIINNSGKGKLFDIRNCRFEKNSGGYIILYSNNISNTQSTYDTLIIEGNSFLENDVFSVIRTESGTSSKINIDFNTFASNVADNGLIDNYNQNSNIVENSISGNQIFNNGSSRALALKSEGDKINIYNNLIVHNKCIGDASTLIEIHDRKAEIINNTLSNNEGNVSLIKANFSDFLAGENPYIIRNNIFYSNSGTDFDFTGDQSLLQLDYNLLSSEHAGTNHNIDSQPAFKVNHSQMGLITDVIPQDWYLSAGSPCIDAGHPGSEYFDKSENGVVIPPAMGTELNDMGSFGGNNYPNYIAESVTICEGNEYAGKSNEGYYYELLQNSNGKDSIITTKLNIIDSDLNYLNPLPAEGKTMTGGAIEFSWNYNSPDSLDLFFEVYYSLDRKIWYKIYEGFDTHFEKNFAEYYFYGKDVYWYVSNHDSYCPRNSPVWQFSIDMITNLDEFCPDNFSFSVIPNPSHGEFIFHLNSDNEKDLRLQLFNSKGQLVAQEYFSSFARGQSFSFNLTHLEKGVYYLVGVNKRLFFNEKIFIY